MDEALHMWSFYRERYGRKEALEQHYQTILERNPVLTAALLQIEIAERAIDATMESLRECAEDD